MTLPKQKQKQEGQAAVEFILISVVIFFFLFMLLSMSIVFVVSSYLDYATFMAARTYKAGAFEPASQERAARSVFLAYFDKVNGIARNPQLEFVRTQANNVRTEGIVTSWNIDLFYLPPVFLGANGPTSAIRLTSEAHLGRDPSSAECSDFFVSFLRRFGVGEEFVSDMEDNGC
jgi:Flp pilus assembly protein TadG